MINKNLIGRLFTIKEVNKMGYYSVWLFIDGKWTYITIDIQPNQIWPMIIEKAWAKLYQQYSSLWGGNTAYGLRAVTGCPTKCYKLKKYVDDPRKQTF
ncbi:hypothetical protein IMG5_069930 [Ichthyophthirius multifiliis]|uniref:Calpain catalytic domain-containing protein n=1 Tax=Ichthyophthirius multifiliis TaxID=5932 RepID=G0QPP2_ICHMU|nr:hypothetical protein IMG5_069930 [Ichthyophthirius multifiliis]EGR32820.1 hypothetical protein IMG5_069930 [Ichthyophthirius multifiliis]|eukprot:XP_004036806.1 hypothetical protein IMG5_069930 [Ichthyophthirius multifiliis]